MALEDLTGTKYIDDLNSSNPAAGDNVSEGDDHIRGIKNVLKLTLPNITGAVTATHTELNYVDGVTSAVQSQLNTIIADDWVTQARMAVNSIDSDQYVDGSIDTAHIADDQVTLAKMAGLARGKVIIGDSSGNPAALAVGSNGQVLKSDGTDISWAADSGLSTEEVQDIAGGMFTSNTETGITATYQDGDGTVDLVIGAGDIVNSMLADDAVDSDEIAAGAIDLAHMSANSIDSTQYVDGSIDTAHYAAGSVDATAMGVNSVDSSELVDGSVDASHLAADSVTAAKIGDDVINSEHYAAGSIDNEHLADDAVDSDELAAGAVDLAHMSVNSIDSDQYVDGSIDTAHIANDAITTAKIADNVTLGGNVTVSGNFTVSGDTTTVNTATLAVEDPLVSLATGNSGADAVDIGMYGLYDTSGSQDLYGGLFRDANDSGKWKLFKDNQAEPTTTVNVSGTGYAVGTLVANLEGTLTAANSVDSDQYVDGSIDRVHLAADIVDGTKIANDSINSEHIAADSIDAEHYAAGSVDATALGADCVTAAKIGDNVLNSEHYVAGSIDAEHLASDSVTEVKIAANSIDSQAYVDGSIDTVHLSADCVTAAKIGDNVLNSEHYAAGSIDAEHLASDSVTEAKMAANSVDSQAYVDGSIDAAHLSTSLGDLRRGVTDIGRDANDCISIGTTIIDFKLDGATDMRLENDGDLHVEGDVIAFSSTISDEALKYDINPIEHALDKVAQLTGVTYKYLKDGMESAGLLAQDVEKVMPCAVRERKLPLHKDDGKLYKTLNYDNLHALLIESIKELTAKVAKLENK